MVKVIQILALLIVISISGCTETPLTGDSIKNISQDAATDIASLLNIENAAKAIANLPNFDKDSIDQFETYKELAGDMNTAIEILKTKSDVFKDVPRIGETVEDYNKFLNILEKWTPLINNYNELIIAANGFDKDNQTSVNNFYTKSATFAFEFSIIYTAAFYGPAYESVGMIYRMSGMQTLALKCAPCVSAVLSQSHWIFRGALVEASSKSFEKIVDCMENKNLSLQSVEEATNCFTGQITNTVNNTVSSINTTQAVDTVNSIVNSTSNAVSDLLNNLGIKTR